MHERSLAQGLLNEVDVVRQQRQLGRIVSVTIEIGEFCGVEPRLLHTAFEDLWLEAFQHSVTLDCRILPLEGACEECGTNFRIVDFCFRCPDCQGQNIEIIHGEEFRLLKVVAEPNSTNRRVVE